MTSAEIPEIRSLSEAVLLGVGEHVEVFLHDNNPSNGYGVSVQRTTNEMIRDVVDGMFQRLCVEPNRDLHRLCAVAAQIAVGKIATSQGFNIEFGPYGDRNRLVRVDLQRQLQIVEAEVTHSD